jgi:hypothetical protein
MMRWVQAALVLITATALIAVSPASASAAPLGCVLDSTLPRTSLTTPESLGSAGTSGLQYPDPLRASTWCSRRRQTTRVTPRSACR